MGKVSSIDDRKILIYRHRRLDTGKIFYVGIAVIPTRPYDKKSRNKLWQNIVSKTDYSVEIIGIVDNWDLACELEELLIREYGRKDLGTGCLVNMTDGGDGRFGSIFSLETKLKMSKAKLGKKRPKDIGIKISKNKLGKKHSVEGRNKKVKALGKKVIDTETNKIYLSITEASLAFNIAPGMLSRYLSGKRNNKTTLKYL